MRLLYTGLLYLLLPLALLRLYWRSRRDPGHRRRWRERLGWIASLPESGCLWVHAVSVGEARAALPLIRALLARYPDRPVLVTTTTLTGSRQVQEALGDRVGKEIFMYSITINPAHDTPAVLKEYAQKFQVGPGWQFLTGKESDINLLRKKLGLYEEGEARTDHTMNLIVGNEATGQWKQRSTFDNPKILARVVGDELFNFSRPRNNETSYAQAPLTLKIDPGEDLFRRRCQVCHTVGGGDALGPDLAGVADIRDRAWLTRWLQEPDKMLAEKDPVAATLYAKYKEVPMPNLRLSDRDTELLIAYLESESRRISNTRPQFEHEGHGRLQAASSSGAGVAHLGQAAGEAPHTPFQSP